MTRDEFSEQMYQHYQEKNRLMPDNTTLKSYKQIWWHNSIDSHKWRLSMPGLRQMLCKPEFIPSFKCTLTDQNLIMTPKLTQSLYRMNFPWFIITSSNGLKQQTLQSIWIFDSKASFWLTLCGNNLTQFLAGV
jgi:hypothetical protein